MLLQHPSMLDMNPVEIGGTFVVPGETDAIPAPEMVVLAVFFSPLVRMTSPVLPRADWPCCLQLQELLLSWQPQGFQETVSSCAQSQLITCRLGSWSVVMSGSPWACHLTNEFCSL